MSTIWADIQQNFKDLLENSSTGVGSFINISNKFKESTDCIKLDSQPSSIFNGKFSIQLNGINSIGEDIGLGIQDFNYDVLLQLSFKITSNVSKDTYNNAIQDIEEIIRKRLDYSTWLNSNILNIQFVSCSPFRFLNNEESEFCVVDVIFRITGRTYTSNP